MEFKRVTVKKNERGLLLRNGDFERVLRAGHALAVRRLDTLRVETFALEQPAFTHGLADYLMAAEPAVVAAEFVRVELGETPGRPAQRERRAGRGAGAGHAAPVLEGPGRRAGRGDRHRARRPRCRPALVARLVQTQLRQRAVAGLAGVLQVQVPEHARRRAVRSTARSSGCCAPGSYAFWKFNRNVSVELVDLRLQALEVTGQEILTRDKVAPAPEPVGHLALHRRADGLHAAGQAGGPPVPRAAVRPARGGGHAHARRAAGEQDGDRRGRDRARRAPSSRPTAWSWTAWA